MTEPVSFELAELLKEKGFEVPHPVAEHWDIGGKQYVIKPYEEGYDELHSEYPPDDANFLGSAPTIAEVIMWLYEKHSLWLLAIPTVTGHFAYKIVDVQLDPENTIERPPYKDVSAEDYNSPTEAYSAAIKYTLKNLI